MATQLKRFTISLTNFMESELEKIRQERYDGVTKSDMIRDLITRGLNTLATDRRGEKE